MIHHERQIETAKGLLTALGGTMTSSSQLSSTTSAGAAACPAGGRGGGVVTEEPAAEHQRGGCDVPPRDEGENTPPERLVSEAARTQLVELCVHTADIGNGCQPLSIALQWKDRILQEFSAQASKEAELMLPVTSYMQNLEDPIVAAKSQISFIGFVVAPLMQVVTPLFGIARYEDAMSMKKMNR
eukprot:g18884.t1